MAVYFLLTNIIYVLQFKIKYFWWYFIHIPDVFSLVASNYISPDLCNFTRLLYKRNSGNTSWSLPFADLKRVQVHTSKGWGRLYFQKFPWGTWFFPIHQHYLSRGGIEEKTPKGWVLMYIMCCIFCFQNCERNGIVCKSSFKTIKL